MMHISSRRLLSRRKDVEKRVDGKSRGRTTAIEGRSTTIEGRSTTIEGRFVRLWAFGIT
jgi:hypothetical protein